MATGVYTEDDHAIDSQVKLRVACLKLAIGCSEPDEGLAPYMAQKVAQYFFDYCITGTVHPFDDEDD